MEKLIKLDSHDWAESGSSELYQQWDEPGTEVIGKLISITQVPHPKGYQVKKATIETDDGKVGFYLTTDLEKKLLPTMVGCMVSIEYINGRRTTAGNTFKMFRVRYHKPVELENSF